jgi:flap endonuclease-1
MEPIKGIGPKTALKLLREHDNIEGVLAHIKDSGKKITIPEVWPFEEAREIFKRPDVKNGKDQELTWKAPDVEKLVEFMCGSKGFK